MNDLVKQQVINEMIEYEFHPVMTESNLELSKCTEFSLASLASFGAMANQTMTALQAAAAGGSGIYRVTVPAGGHLAKFKDGSGFLGSALNSNNQLGGQAVLNPVMFNPTVMMAAVAVAAIDQKLSKIYDFQQELADYLTQKDKSALRGDLNFLSDTINNYKFNLENDTYKQSHHIKILDIRHQAEKNIDFYRNQIMQNCKTKGFLTAEGSLKKQIDKVTSNFSDYQFSVYLNAFAYFIDVLLLGNYDEQFLDGIITKLKKQAMDYRELYTEVYTIFSDKIENSVESAVLKGLSKGSDLLGKVVSKLPDPANVELDEKLIELSDKVEQSEADKTIEMLRLLREKKSANTHVFVENVSTINKLYNKEAELYFNEDKIFVELT